MQKYLLFIVIAVALVGIGGYSRFVAGNAPAPSSGEAIFDDQCSTCHGVNGEGIPAWKAKVNSMSLAQVQDRVRNGGGGMPSFSKTLSDQQVTAVASYAKQLASGK